MSDQAKSDIPLRPVLPRNLTAHASYLVPGNPMTARPESGVGNAHPGLEFDVRALDRHFLPGLIFDFQYGVGAKLVGLMPERLAANPGIAASDIERGLYLWAVHARFGDDPAAAKVVRLIEKDGYMVLRRIMDLELGPITAVVGVLPDTTELKAMVNEVLDRLVAGQPLPPGANGGGAPAYYVVSGDRARYLTADGVIDPDLLSPGEITSNLCSPWQWDFADCYCYYWASSKPDLVVGISGEAQVLNFQRHRDEREPVRPPVNPDKWMANNISEPEMIADWETLPIVTSEREGVVPRIPRWPLIEDCMSREEIARELRDLASLEHALCVEYLYAKYSIRAGRRPPMSIRAAALRRYKAASEVFSIAVDEMRHFRWVNEALRLLGHPPTVKRAEVIARDLHRSFRLRPLIPNTLDEFIGIEAPSSVFNDDPQQLDGTYTRILVSLHHLEARATAGDATLRRLQHLLKIIIDEGDSHWHRFLRIKQHLAGAKSTSYLRYQEAPGPAKREPELTLQRLCDAYYDLLLRLLYITFFLGKQSSATWLTSAHAAMFSLDEAAWHLSTRGFAPCFTLPQWCEGCPSEMSEEAAWAVPLSGDRGIRPSEVILSAEPLERMFDLVFQLLEQLAASGAGWSRRLAAQQLARMRTAKQNVLDAYR
jgi:hypothetical protein